MKFFTITCVFLLIFLTGRTQTTITLKPDQSTGKSAEIWSLNPENNYGGVTDYIAAYWTWDEVPAILRSLIQFDLSSIPNRAKIASAKISLYYNSSTSSDGQAGTNASHLQRIITPWSQSTVTWNNQPATTIQNQVTLPQSTSINQDYPNVDVTSLVQDMVNNPSQSDGFMISLADETTLYSSMKFCSSYIADTSKRPSLTITYYPDSSDNTNCVSFQPGSVTGKYGEVWSLAPDSNLSLGGNTDFIAAYWTWGDSGLLRSYLQFDLSSIPSNATITSADLSLYYNYLTSSRGQESNSGGTNATFLQRVTGPWNMQSLSWNNQPTVTEVDEVSLPQSTSINENYPDIDVTDLVKDMISNTNYGLRMILQNETIIYNSMKFFSSNAPDSSLAPYLQVCYTVPTSVPVIAGNNGIEISTYPNPFIDRLKVNIRGNVEQIGNVSLVDVIGKPYNVLYKSGPGVKNANELNLLFPDNLPGGIYFLRVTVGNSVVVKKIIKN